MKEKYLYNPNRHTLHIKDYCPNAKGNHPAYLTFDSEDEALAYDGRAVGFCKFCLKERERRMEETK